MTEQEVGSGSAAAGGDQDLIESLRFLDSNQTVASLAGLPEIMTNVGNDSIRPAQWQQQQLQTSATNIDIHSGNRLYSSEPSWSPVSGENESLWQRRSNKSKRRATDQRGLSEQKQVAMNHPDDIFFDTNISLSLPSTSNPHYNSTIIPQQQQQQVQQAANLGPTTLDALLTDHVITPSKIMYLFTGENEQVIQGPSAIQDSTSGAAAFQGQQHESILPTVLQKQNRDTIPLNSEELWTSLLPDYQNDFNNRVNTTDSSSSSSLSSFKSTIPMQRSRETTSDDFESQQERMPIDHPPQPQSSSSSSFSRNNNGESSSSSKVEAKKRHQCPHPGREKDFSTSGHARRHSRIHDDVHPFVCPHQNCPATFTRKDNLKQHRRIKHSSV